MIYMGLHGYFGVKKLAIRGFKDYFGIKEVFLMEFFTQPSS